MRVYNSSSAEVGIDQSTRHSDRFDSAALLLEMSVVLFSQHEPVILDSGTLCSSVSSLAAAVIDWRVLWCGNSRNVTSSDFIASYLYS